MRVARMGKMRDGNEGLTRQALACTRSESNRAQASEKTLRPMVAKSILLARFDGIGRKLPDVFVPLVNQ